MSAIVGQKVRLPNNCTCAESRLRLVQSELRQITGTSIKDEADRLRRMALWRELDELVREALHKKFPPEGGKRVGDTDATP
jgi:hypothetical protein